MFKLEAPYRGSRAGRFPQFRQLMALRRIKASGYVRALAALAAMLIAAVLAPATALSSPPSNAFRFVHDADGRLKAAIDPEGDTAVYSWDAAGNLLSISRHASSKLSIAELSPAKGEVGATVTIEGTGFSTTPTSDTVKFNGTAATVSAASATSLTVKVPGGATTGSVTVSTPGEGPVTSPESFTVAESSAPHISSISPSVAAAGEEITMSGSNFEPTIAANSLTLNQSRPEMTSASSSTIKFKVPTATLGGHISVATPEGSSTGPDLFIPPNGIAASKVGSTGRFSLGASKTVEFAGSEKVALLLFDGTAGHRVSMSFSESTVTSGSVSIWSSSGTQIASSSFSKSEGGFLEETSPLPSTGTYTVLFTPSGASAGSVKMASYDVPGLTGSITPAATAEGTTQHVGITIPGQNARYSVTVTAGERVSLRTNNSNFTGGYQMKWLKPNGEILSSIGFGAKENWFWDPQTFTSAGTYTLMLDPTSAYTGSVDLQLWEDPDITGQTITPSAEGGSVTSTIKVPGQRELVTFSGTKEQKIFVNASESTISGGGSISILKPGGSELSGSNGSFGFHEPVTLPETGTYTFVIDPYSTGSSPISGATGSIKLTAYAGEDLTGSITPAATAEGTTQHVGITIPGQNARYSVTVTAGERVSLRTNNSNFTGGYQMKWLKPNGEILSSIGFGAKENWFWDPQTFTSAGTYTLMLDPTSAYTGSVDLQLWEDPDITGQTITPSAEGGSVTSTIKVPGQRELVTFSGTKEQKIFVNASESTISGGGSISILKPGGSELSGSNGSFGFHEPVTLPETGTYTFVIDPYSTGSSPISGATGSIKLTAYAGEDLTGSITPAATAEGTTQHVGITIPGQNARYSVTVTAGERVSLRTNNSNFTGGYQMKWLKPNGEILSSIGFGAKENWFWDPQTFTSAGTYTLMLDPTSAYTGSVDLQLWEDPDITGQTITPSAEGGSVTSTIKVPGQRELVTFSGTKEESLSWKPTENTISGSGEIKILKPNGSELAGGGAGFTAGFHNPIILPETGTYTFVIDPYSTGSSPVSNGTGSIKLTAYEVSGGSITPAATAEGTTQHVATSFAGQVSHYSVTMTAGEKVSLRTNNSNFTAGYTIKWLNSKGESVFSEHWSAKENWFWDTKTFTTAGTYTLVVDPDSAATGSVDLQLWEDPDITGQTITPSTEGGSVTSTIKVPGQRELIAFSGAASQLVTVKATESTIASGTMSVLKPDGSLLSGSEKSFSSSSSGRAELTLPTTGTYKVVIDPSSTGSAAITNGTGSVKVTVYLGSHVAWFGPMQSTTELASLVTSNPPQPPGYSNISGRSPANSSHSEVASSSSTSVSPTRGFEGKGHRSSHPERSRKGRSKNTHHRTNSRPNRHVKKGALAAELRAFHPAAVKVWHPPRNIPGWEAAEPKSPWAKIGDLQAPAGTTALAGQALERNGLPLAGVHLSVEGTSTGTTTDESGRFLLSGLPAGHQTLVVDGESVPGDRRYGSYEVSVDLADHKTTTLDYTIWLTPLDRAGNRQIASPTEHETNLTTPSVPGLEVRIPAGTVIRSAAGKTVKDLNITAIPVNQAPFPLPPFVPIPVYFTIQPGRAYLSKGAQIVYPNWGDLRPGQRAEFWNYDPKDRGWYVYGRGTVSADGKQVVPDPGVRVWQFTGAMLASSPLPPGTGPTGTSSGDPVDLFSGLFTYHQRDLALPDTLPIDIQRTYRPADSNSYSFGIGTTNQYDLRLWSGAGAAEANLILPSGQRVHYVRISAGTGFSDGEYKSTSTPGPFYASTLKYNPSGGGAYWNLQLTNGMTYVFGVGRLLEVRDSHGNKLVITRSGEDMTQITAPHGRWVKFTYDGSHRITELTDNGGRHVKYTYTSGRLTKVVGLGGRTTEYEYDGSGRMKAVINARGNKYLQVAYDANGRVEKQTSGDGATFGFAYKLNKAGEDEATTITDPLGRQREVQFNSQGFPTNETEAPGTELAQTTSIERQPETGLILSETDPLGRETDLEYDSNGNVKEATRLAGTGEAQTTKYAYETGTNRITEETDPLGHTTKYQYGVGGELLKRTDPLGHEVTFEYNSDGQPTAITNAESETTKLGYESGDLVAVTNPLGRTTSQFVDALGRVRAITLPGGERYLYGYNEANQPTSVRTPSGAETTMEYDADGNPIKLIDPRGGETISTYDTMDRIESETDPLKHTAEWSYDKDGELVEAIDRRGQVSQFGHDGLGRLASASFGVLGETAESTIGYEYDEGNRLTKVSDSASGEFAPSYDNLDQLTGIEGPNGSVGYEYDAAGRRTLMTAPGLGTVAYEYDKANRLTEVAGGEQNVSLGYDKADRLEHLTLPDGIEQRYGYDKAGETTSIAYKHGESTLGEIDYAFDVDGRTEAMWGSYARLALPEALKSAKYNAGNEMIEREGKELSYDADGNPTSDGSSEYSWDARGQLSAISGAHSASFGYDPFGRRISKTLGGTTTELLYDGPNVVQESVEGSVTADLLTGLRPDQLFARMTGGGTDSYLTDKLGSTIALANGSAETKTSYTYDPFGGATEAGEPSDNPFQFTGRENDGTGLQYNRARYYNPMTGRFISRDPAGFNGSGSNLYWYTFSDPLDFTDPSGECAPWELCIPNPITTTEDAAHKIGNWVSNAPGAASKAAELVEGVENEVGHFFEIHTHPQPCPGLMADINPLTGCPEVEHHPHSPDPEPPDITPIMPIDPQHPVPVEPSVPRIPIRPISPIEIP